MSSSSSDKELEEQLAEAGRKLLLEPQAPVDELLPLLDRVETCLSRVEQSPSKSMQKALSPSQKALVANRLFRHSDVDVKVAVASCISEITRISAPEAPYDDDQMKEVFQLIVSSFQNLSDKSSRSYVKRASILETVAKVRSCVVMLDLECDTLILEMFEHFLKEIREYHPENVFASMETIMTLVIEESEDISPELLSPVLASVKKDNEDVLPIAKKLGEKVLEKCAVKLRPYLAQALKSSGVVLDDYSKVIASICQDTNGGVEQTDIQDMEKERLAEEPSTQDVPAPGESSKTVVNNGSTQLGKDDSMVDPVSLKKEEDGKESASKTADASSNGDLDKLDNEKAQKEESKPEQATKRRGRRTNISSKSVKSSNISRVDDKDAENVKDAEKEPGNDAPSLPLEDLKCEAKLPSQSEKEGASEPSTDKVADDESKDDVPKDDESKDDVPKDDESNVSALPTLTKEIPDDSQPQEAGSPKDKEDSAEEVKPSSVDISKKESAETAGLLVETDTKGVDDSADDMSSKERTITIEETSKETSKEDDATSGSDVKMLKQSEKKVNASTSGGEGTSRKKPEDRRKLAKSRLASEKNVKKSAGKYDKKGTPSSPKVVKRPVKDEKYLGETSKDNFKRKRSSGKEEDSEAKTNGEDLVGSKIKVWWPLDKQYYEGVIEAFDNVQKKHKVLYEDGDVEILNLEAEKWKLVEGDSGDKGQAADRDSSDASPEMPLKKKAKVKPGLASAKKVKIDMSPKKSGGASSGKSKASAATTSGHKSRDGRKTDGNVEKDRTPKSSGKATLKTSGKSKDTELMTLKTGKSKANDASARSVSTKSDREIQKSDKSMRADKSTSKGKGPRSLGKANTSSFGKLKLGSAKPKEDESEDEDSEETPEVPLSKKARLLESSKALSESLKSQGGKSSTGKKRRKGA
ncbi:sister chromatid cohesion protein PDS5 homolog C-like [Syzygium oleosum]|uniref:sister chromatid cohesion protein PDS5 homolog C-like n=1 Tax=Syzygium oleosum TaxID=219896 RepID=UPI0024BB6713|nr:sister chromatid cohesion protein PDS5 homolog C-like [Syzygium oleosum]